MRANREIPAQERKCRERAMACREKGMRSGLSLSAPSLCILWRDIKRMTGKFLCTSASTAWCCKITFSAPYDCRKLKGFSVGFQEWEKQRGFSTGTGKGARQFCTSPATVPVPFWKCSTISWAAGQMVFLKKLEGNYILSHMAIALCLA